MGDNKDSHKGSKQIEIGHRMPPKVCDGDWMGLTCVVRVQHNDREALTL